MITKQIKTEEELNQDSFIIRCCVNYLGHKLVFKKQIKSKPFTIDGDRKIKTKCPSYDFVTDSFIEDLIPSNNNIKDYNKTVCYVYNQELYNYLLSLDRWAFIEYITLSKLNENYKNYLLDEWEENKIEDDEMNKMMDEWYWEKGMG